NEENLIQLNNYVESKQQYEFMKLDTSKYIPLEQINNDDTKIIKDLLSIEEFLYSDISLETLDNIYKLNEDILTIVSLFESDIKDLSEYTDISEISKVSEIKNIHVGLALLSEIDKELYVNCTLDTGTIKYIEIARKGNKETLNIKSLLTSIESIFIAEEIYLHEIIYFENLKLNLIDKKDSFFKIFSTSFKKAKNEYISLLVGEAEEDINIWLEQLDGLINYLNIKKEYENNIEYQDTFKNLFKGLSTNWNEIIKLHNWGEKVRSKIRLKSYIDIILKGEEQIYLSLTSYLSSFTKNLQDFDELIISLEVKYKASFRRKLYRHVVDIDFIDLKNILDDINEKTLEYIPFIKKININEKIEIEQITCFIKEYNDSKNTFEKYKNIIEIISTKYLDNKLDIDMNKFLSDIIKILEKQNLKISNISLQLSEERKLDSQILELGSKLKELILNIIQITKKQTLDISKVSQQLSLEKELDEKILLIDDETKELAIRVLKILEIQELSSTQISLKLKSENILDKQILELGPDLKELVLNIIQITRKQTLDISKVSALLKEENNLNLKLNNMINYIENTAKYKVAKTNNEIVDLTKHISIINSINKTNINNDLKELLLEQFSITYEILKNISIEYLLTIEINNNLSKYGTFKENKFYGKDTIKYLDLINKLNLLE
ncbi:MAG: hypothetical protein U9N59_08940, partial [Campylobacterota bacterium]|nr:hypothetical protein [Campylobacterota bacterium]